MSSHADMMKILVTLKPALPTRGLKASCKAIENDLTGNTLATMFSHDGA